MGNMMETLVNERWIMTKREQYCQQVLAETSHTVEMGYLSGFIVALVLVAGVYGSYRLYRYLNQETGPVVVEPTDPQ